MPHSDITVFAETTFRNQLRRFGIKTDDRRRHMYLIGKTGMGKSTVLENMIIEDIRAGRGVAVVDPHGDLAEKIIEYIPANRVNDIIYFNPSDIEFPIAFNVVEHVGPQQRHLVASGLIGVFQKLWADSWGPRLEYILRNTILAVLEYPGSTLLAVTRMLSDKKFRKRVVDNVQDPVVKSFWVNEFASYADKFASEAVSPIQNKVGQFLSTALIRNIVGQVKSTIDIRKMMDEGKVLIMNLAKGRIGEDASQLLGAMMITKIQLAAMSRVDMAEADRKDFYLYIDEFQNFTTDSFANILSEARKYRLNLVMAHQYIEQLGLIVKPAVFGNVGTMAVFRVGAADALELVPEFTPTFTEEDIVNLPKYEFYIKLMIDGMASTPFSARGLAPLTLSEKTDNTEKVIRICRERYAKEREVVEDKIRRWHLNGDDEDDVRRPAPAPVANNTTALKPQPRPALVTSTQAPRLAPASAPFAQAPVPVVSASTARPESRPAASSASAYRFSAKCARCGNETSTSFQPDGIRPVFCRDCLPIVKQEKINEVERRRQAKSEELRQLEARGVQSPRPTLVKRSYLPSVAEETAAPSKVPELSLSEALSKPPVTFHEAKTNTSVTPKPKLVIVPPRFTPPVTKETRQLTDRLEEGQEIVL